MEDQEQTSIRPMEVETTDPRLVAVQEAYEGLKAACNELPPTPGRMHALAHLDAVKIYAAQAIREEAEQADA